MLPYQTISQKENGIAIIGIGGAGANVLQCFGSSSADNVKLCTMSLDERVGRACGNVEFVQLGEGLSHGLGSGGDPEVGRRAMEESEARVRELLADAKLLVMVVGLGGGTGSGAAPVLARMARESGLFLVSVVMMPFTFEGKRRREQAELAQEEIARLSDIVFCFENDYMEELFRSRTGARAVFEEVDRLLAKATASVPMMASSPGLINLGLDELAAALQNQDSRCIFGSGSGYGAKRAEQAARAAVESPLATYHGALRFARTVIVHIAGGESMSLTEIRQAMEIVQASLGGEDVQIFFGATVKSHLGDEMRITLIASIDAEEFKMSFQRTEIPLRPAEPTPDIAEEEAAQDEPEPPLPDEEEEPEAVTDEELPTEDTAEDEDIFSEGEEEDLTEVEPEPAPEPEAAAPEEAEEPLSATEEEEEESEPEPPAPEPRTIITPAPERRSAPAAPQQAPQQLDLFSSAPMRQNDASDRYTPSASRYRGGESYDELPPSFTPKPVESFSPDTSRLRQPTTGDNDDLDTPPSMRFNDLRNIFPE